MNFTLLQISVSDITQQTVTAPQQSMSLWDLVVKGGPIMIPLALLSIVAVYIFFDRLFAIRNASKEDTTFMNRIKDYIHEGKIESAISLCQATDSPVARMIEKGINRMGRPLNDINASIENVGNSEITKLEKGLPMLATVAGGAPMIGFLGTVIGMVSAFYHMSLAGNNINITVLSSGIYVAMVTTVGGLIVGITAYFAYNYLITRVHQVMYMMEGRITEFMDLLNEPAN